MNSKYSWHIEKKGIVWEVYKEVLWHSFLTLIEILRFRQKENTLKISIVKKQKPDLIIRLTNKQNITMILC